MHAAHARNSDQEFLELELYHDFSRCNPNSHEICMSQIARYVDDRINGGSFSSHLRYWEAGKRGDPEARERDRGATARGCINVFTRYSRVSSSSRQRVSRSYWILSSPFHVPPILFPIFQRSTLFTPRAPIPFASFYLSERFRARWFTAAITHGRERRRWPESIERAAAARRRLEEIVDAANVRSSSVSTPTRFTSDVITQTARAAGWLHGNALLAYWIASGFLLVTVHLRRLSALDPPLVLLAKSARPSSISRIFQREARGDCCAVGWRRWVFIFAHFLRRVKIETKISTIAARVTVAECVSLVRI